jgi:hypothetical protein
MDTFVNHRIRIMRYSLVLLVVALCGCLSKKNCKNAICTEIFASISVNLKDTTNPKMIGIRTVTIMTRSEKTIHTQSEPDSFNPQRFTVVDDSDLKDIGFNASENLEFRIFKDDKLIKSTSYVVKTDCCHVGKFSGLEEIILH